MKIYIWMTAILILAVIPCKCAYALQDPPQVAKVPNTPLQVANPMAAYFPAKAKKARMSGVVVVSCSVRGDGGFELCQIVREMPANYGFGAATLKMVSEIGQADLKLNKPGDVVQATIKWTYSPDK